MSDLEMPWIKKTQNIYNFCFHGNGTNWQTEILQTAAFLMQIILFL